MEKDADLEAQVEELREKVRVLEGKLQDLFQWRVALSKGHRDLVTQVNRLTTGFVNRGSVLKEFYDRVYGIDEGLQLARGKIDEAEANLKESIERVIRVTAAVLVLIIAVLLMTTEFKFSGGESFFGSRSHNFSQVDIAVSIICVAASLILLPPATRKFLVETAMSFLTVVKGDGK